MAVNWGPVRGYIANQGDALAAAADCLVEGHLALLLGAGVSRSLGFPVWFELVKQCLDRSGFAVEAAGVTADTDGETLRNLAQKVESAAPSKREYFELVSKCLYDNCPTDRYAVIRQELLIALGALLMGSRRGSVKEVITFNFDDVVEWYLDVNGFTTNVVTGLPYLQSSADVAVFHPHGFLPRIDRYAGQFSKDLVFSQFSYAARVGANWDPWTALTRHMFATRIFLAVGLSTKDPQLEALLYNATENLKGARPTGFWICKANDSDAISWVTHYNVVPICVEDWGDIPKVVFGICQRAADQM
jgi:hypothetical protein